MDIDKAKLKSAVKALLERQITELESLKNNLQESIVSEDKNTAGDKYETARAQAQNEMENIAKRININLQSLSNLSRLSVKPMHVVQMGALVETNLKLFYFAVPFGNFQFEGQVISVISPASPIGQNALQKTVGDTITFGNQNHKIVSIK